MIDDDKYDLYLDELFRARRRSVILNTALAEGSAGEFVHKIAGKLIESLESAASLWEPEFGNLIPRLESDPMTENFLDALCNRKEVPNTIPPEWSD